MRSSSTGPSILSSYMSSNLVSGHTSPTKHFFWEKPSGGGNSESEAILNELSSMVGMSLARRGLDNSRQGLVLTSIK